MFRGHLRAFHHDQFQKAAYDRTYAATVESPLLATTGHWKPVDAAGIQRFPATSGSVGVFVSLARLMVLEIFKPGIRHGHTSHSPSVHSTAIMPKKTKKDTKQAQQDGQKPNTRSRANLPTPEPTPGVDAGRIAADEARRAAEATIIEEEEETEDPKKELERILGCADDAHAEILRVEPDASDDDILRAWRQLGCLVHPQYCQLEKAKDAFKSRWLLELGPNMY